MVLRKNKKGTIAIMDAMVFLALLSIVATGMFAYSAVFEENEPMAKTVSDQLFSTNLRACDICDCSDSEVLPLPTLIAVNMNLGDDDRTEDYLSEALDVLIPMSHGYALEIDYNGHSLDLYRESTREMSSQYGHDLPINGAGTMHVSLTIY